MVQKLCYIKDDDLNINNNKYALLIYFTSFLDVWGKWKL